jgi:hypothetical protein
MNRSFLVSALVALCIVGCGKASDSAGEKTASQDTAKPTAPITSDSTPIPIAGADSTSLPPKSLTQDDVTDRLSLPREHRREREARSPQRLHSSEEEIGERLSADRSEAERNEPRLHDRAGRRRQLYVQRHVHQTGRLPQQPAAERRSHSPGNHEEDPGRRQGRRDGDKVHLRSGRVIEEGARREKRELRRSPMQQRSRLTASTVSLCGASRLCPLW